MSIKKPIKIVLIVIGSVIALYFIFILLLLKTPLWEYMPKSIRMTVAEYKIEHADCGENCVLYEEMIMSKVDKDRSNAEILLDKNVFWERKCSLIQSMEMTKAFTERIEGQSSFTPEEVEALYQVVADEENHPKLRNMALNTLIDIKPLPQKVVDLMTDLVQGRRLGPEKRPEGYPKNPDEPDDYWENSRGGLVGTSISGLAEVGDVNILAQLLRDTDSSIRAGVLTALSIIAEEDPKIIDTFLTNDLLWVVNNDPICDNRDSALFYLDSLIAEKYDSLLWTEDGEPKKVPGCQWQIFKEEELK